MASTSNTVMLGRKLRIWSRTLCIVCSSSVIKDWSKGCMVLIGNAFPLRILDELQSGLVCMYNLYAFSELLFCMDRSSLSVNCLMTHSTSVLIKFWGILPWCTISGVICFKVYDGINACAAAPLGPLLPVILRNAAPPPSSSILSYSSNSPINLCPKNKCKSTIYANSSFDTNEKAVPTLPCLATRPTLWINIFGFPGKS